MEERIWVPQSMCYYEPKVHDFELYFQLTKINIYFLLPLAVLGILFNSAALVSLYNPPKISSGVFIYLRALLILDHCQILMTSAASLIPQICDSHHSQNHTLYQFCMFERRFLEHLLPRLESTINGMHIWMVAALSTHRYWKISRPVISRVRDTVLRAQIIILSMLFVALAYRAPIFFIELQMKRKPFWRIQRRPEMTQVVSWYRFIYHSIVDPALSNLIPFLWMAVFSLLTLYEIFRSREFTYRQLYFQFNDSKGKHKTFATCFPNRAESMRQRQELRATVSIILIIVLYLILHSLQFYNVIRKWQLLITAQCPTRTDYMQSQISNVLSMFSASVNAFVYIAFTNRLQRYIRQFMRRTSRTLSTSTDPPLSPQSAIAFDHALMCNRTDYFAPNSGIRESPLRTMLKVSQLQQMSLYPFPAMGANDPNNSAYEDFGRFDQPCFLQNYAAADFMQVAIPNPPQKQICPPEVMNANAMNDQGNLTSESRHETGAGSSSPQTQRLPKEMADEDQIQQAPTFAFLPRAVNVRSNQQSINPYQMNMQSGLVQRFTRPVDFENNYRHPNERGFIPPNGQAASPEQGTLNCIPPVLQTHQFH